MTLELICGCQKLFVRVRLLLTFRSNPEWWPIGIQKNYTLELLFVENEK